MAIEAEPACEPITHAPPGPRFELIEDTNREALKRSGRQWPFSRPALVKGGAKNQPAFKILLPPDQSAHLFLRPKIRHGRATFSDINVSRLPDQTMALASFEKASGIHARVEAGDALFIPRRIWHSVVSLEPSIRHVRPHTFRGG